MQKPAPVPPPIGPISDPSAGSEDKPLKLLALPSGLDGPGDPEILNALVLLGGAQ